MLVSEIRSNLKKYDTKGLEDIIIELYKRVPKKVKENYNIDDLIINGKVKETVKKENVSLEDLVKEIEYFLSCVDDGYYSTPNKVINKKERSSWRFKVKRYYKELNKVFSTSSEGMICTDLLIEIFKRLSVGSNYLQFVNWETFRAVGVKQEVYYDNIVKRVLQSNIDNGLEKIVDLLEVPKDPYGSGDYMMFKVLIENTISMREKTMEVVLSKIGDLKEKYGKANDSHSKFDIKENINNFVLSLTEMYLTLGKFDKGIKYFKDNYIEERDIEIMEFILLNLIYNLELRDVWIKEYESNIGKIDYRKSLKEMYKELKNE